MTFVESCTFMYENSCQDSENLRKLFPIGIDYIPRDHKRTFDRYIFSFICTYLYLKRFKILKTKVFFGYRIIYVPI